MLVVLVASETDDVNEMEFDNATLCYKKKPNIS